MLIQFSVGNYRSFKNLVTLSLEASTGDELMENTFLASDTLRLLKSVTIYGANGSGKSNIFAAFSFFQQFIYSSFNAQITSKIPVEPFRLSTETEHEPSHFEVVFIHENIRYRYGFEVNSDKVFAEWLFTYPKGKETKLFTRENKDISVNKNKFPEGKEDRKDSTRQNALFLSTVAQYNGEISQKILKWLSTVNVISGLNDQAYMNFSVTKIKDSKFKDEILNFIKNADLNIEDFTTEPLNLTPDVMPEFLTEEVRAQLAMQASKNGVKINTIHKKYDKKNKMDSLVPFELAVHESAGTNRLFFLAAPIIDTLINGKTLFIDEMDSRLHPLVMESLIKLFNSKDKNPNNAQLIFNAHNTLILCKEYFRRDQVWFVQKDRFGVSDLYSLDDYSVRKDSSFDTDYLLGRYGGIPLLGGTYDTKDETKI